jgi:hypothetical protein
MVGETPTLSILDIHNPWHAQVPYFSEEDDLAPIGGDRRRRAQTNNIVSTLSRGVNYHQLLKTLVPGRITFDVALKGRHDGLIGEPAAVLALDRRPDFGLEAVWKGAFHIAAGIGEQYRDYDAGRQGASACRPA